MSGREELGVRLRNVAGSGVPRREQPQLRIDVVTYVDDERAALWESATRCRVNDLRRLTLVGFGPDGKRRSRVGHRR